MKIDKDEFKRWLEHPCTLAFQQLVENQRAELFRIATNRSYNHYYQNEKDPVTTIHFGKCDGMDMVLGMLRSCQFQVQQEVKFAAVPANEKPPIEDVISEYFEEEKDDK